MAGEHTISNVQGVRNLMAGPISIMWVIVPLALVSGNGWGDALTFWINFFAMVPLAKFMGDVTEELGKYTNQLITGLINSTLGNAFEMIMTVNLLKQHDFAVIKASMLGSVLSNMLLVLGTSFILGGYRHHEQRFNKMGFTMWTLMLLLACVVLILLTIFSNVHTSSGTGESKEALDRQQFISRTCAILMMMSYVASLVFTLRTPEAMMDDEGGDQEKQVGFVPEGREVQTPGQTAEESQERQEEERKKLTLGCALLLLVTTTPVVTILSEYLTRSLEGALKESGISKEFLGIILLPIVGNACEHASAIRFALKNKAGTSLGIAIGSSVQIILFMTPFSVLVGWLLDDDATNTGVNMDLDFGLFNTAILTTSVLVVPGITLDGRSNWVQGFMLCTIYALIALSYWFKPEQAQIPQTD